MKPYGLRNKLRVNLPDNHPKKGWVNWWEAELNTVKRKKLRDKRSKQHLIF